MGAWNSVPLWLNPYDTPPEYDMWGYIPPSMSTPPQHVTGQFYTEGFPYASPLLTSNYRKGGFAVGNPLFVATGNDILDSFGKPLDTVAPADNVYGAYTLTNNAPYAYLQNATQQWVPSASTCNPENYPNCELSGMRGKAPFITPYYGWWLSESKPTTSTDGHATLITTPGSPVKIMDRYLSKIEQHVGHYANGDYNALSDVCDSDTSAYDPCSSGIVERILPFLLGGASVAILESYGKEFTVALPAATQPILVASIFVTFFDIGKGIEDFSLKTDTSWKTDTEQAATALSVGAGAIAGAIAGQNLNYPAYAAIGGGAVGLALQPLAYKMLLPVVTGTGILSALPLIITSFVEKLWCWISNSGLSACDDFGADAGGSKGGYARARRWDVPSLAAKLTDIACVQEGWSRGDPQAQFVYRGLLTNPKWMEAATLLTDINAGNSLWGEDHALNPLGLAAPIHEVGVMDYNTSWNNWDQGWTHDQLVFTGTNKGTGIDPVTGTNRYACQNFDVLYWADQCSTEGDPVCQGPDPPARCAHKCAENQDQQGRDARLASNMKTWLSALITASYDPTNLVKQHAIPGYSGNEFVSLPDEPYDCREYLSTCEQDYDTRTGRGFNSVRQRGDYAALYLKQNDLPNCQGAMLTTIQANVLFGNSYSDLAAAWAYISKTWNEHNLIALAHYMYHDKQPNQEDSFIRYENGYDIVRKLRDDTLPVDFTADPSGVDGFMNDGPYQWGTQHLLLTNTELVPPLTHITPAGTLDDILHEATKLIMQKEFVAARQYISDSGWESSGVWDPKAPIPPTPYQYMYGMCIFASTAPHNLIELLYSLYCQYRGDCGTTGCFFVVGQIAGDLVTGNLNNIYNLLTPTEQTYVFYLADNFLNKGC